MIRNEPMLISASYFWSDAVNAFMFNHGPMTPTLMDVMMLTVLNINAPDRPFRLLEKKHLSRLKQKASADRKDVSARI